MKKIIFSFTLLLLGNLAALAQSGSANQATMGTTSLGFYGGINFQNINGTAANGNALKNKLVTKFHLGVNGEIPIVPDFFIQIGLQYVGKGSTGDVQFTDNNGNFTAVRTLSLNYIELPLGLVYKPLVGSGNLILGFGPYFGYAFSGKVAFEGINRPSDSDVEFIAEVPTTQVNDLIYFKRMDIGANIVVGYQLQNGVFFSLNSQLGLVPINSKTTTELSQKNTGFGLSVGYRL